MKAALRKKIIMRNPHSCVFFLTAGVSFKFFTRYCAGPLFVYVSPSLTNPATGTQSMCGWLPPRSPIPYTLVYSLHLCVYVCLCLSLLLPLPLSLFLTLSLSLLSLSNATCHRRRRPSPSAAGNPWRRLPATSSPVHPSRLSPAPDSGCGVP